MMWARLNPQKDGKAERDFNEARTPVDEAEEAEREKRRKSSALMWMVKAARKAHDEIAGRQGPTLPRL